MSTIAMRHRPGLPTDMPPGIDSLPIHRGYPVPWFVAGKEHGLDDWDFRVIKPGAIEAAFKGDRCWVCGRPMVANPRPGRGPRAYVAGPMCGVNRNSAEPPSHVTCADWSARACPFLTRPHAKRREGGMPEDGSIAPGAIMRNPGVAMVWVTNETIIRPTREAIYFNLGLPSEVRWYAEGRPATREEVMESVRTGLPSLAETCRTDEEREALSAAVVAFAPWLPAE